MKLILNLEFESIAEMQDWIVAEAFGIQEQVGAVQKTIEAGKLAAATGEIASDVREQVETRKAALKEDMKAAAEADLEPAPKQKRKRRTKAEMAAARAMQEEAKKAVAQAKEAEKTEKHARKTYVVERPTKAELEESAPTKGNGSDAQRERAEQFRDLINANSKAAIAALDKHIAEGARFSDGTEAQQLAILAELRGG